jgi:plasmid stability protein
MTITLNIRADVEAELTRQAAAQGRGLEDHAGQLLEKAVQTNGARQVTDQPNNLVEVCAMVQGLTDDLDFGRNPSNGRPIELL